MGSRPVEAVVRFETPAGRQGQVDFATFTLPWGRRHALVVVLSHSRLLWLRFYRRQTMAGADRGAGALLFDQMRAVVLSDGRVGGGEAEGPLAVLRRTSPNLRTSRSSGVPN